MKKSSLIVTIFAFIAIISCTKTNYDLGSEMIPDSEILGFGIDTISSIDSYTRTMDSINTSQWGLVYCGSSLSSLSGKTTFSFISTTLPYSGLSADSIWGTSPTADSVDFVLAIKDLTSGNKELVQRFKIYELNKSLGIKNDSVMTYYSNFDYKSYINPTPIATIDVTGEDTTFLARLPLEYAAPYVDTTGGYYLEDSVYFSKYKGFYIESENGEFSNVCREIDLAASGLYIHYHNKNKKPDTLTGFFSMINQTGVANVAFNLLEHDFSYADPVNGINQSILNDTTTLFSESYVVSQGGLSMQIKLDSTKFKSILEKAKSKGYSTIAVSNASLILPIQNNSLFSLDNAVGKLGCYFDFPTGVTVKDYTQDILQEGTGVNYPYGGELNRALYEYKLDITSYIQTIFNGDENKYSIELAPAYGFDSLPQGVKINREEVKLALTYFLIK